MLVVLLGQSLKAQNRDTLFLIGKDSSCYLRLPINLVPDRDPITTSLVCSKGENIKVHIGLYDQEGKLVYESDEVNENWDVKIKECPKYGSGSKGATFFWVVNIEIQTAGEPTIIKQCNARLRIWE